MEDLAIIIDGRALEMYPLGKAGFHGGTESYVRVLAHGLAQRGHILHVITNDLQHEEQRGSTEWWWGPVNHPTIADVVMPVQSLETVGDISAPFMVFLSNGIDPQPADQEAQIDAYACFSEWHANLLAKMRPGVRQQRCFVTGLGVDLNDYPTDSAPRRVRGRMLAANDPSRGLLPLLDVFDLVRAEIPEAKLHVAYDFDRQFELHRWHQDGMAEYFWECKHRIEATDGVVNQGALSHEDLVREQFECHVHCWPSDPPNIGSQIHGLTQMECAAAGVPLVLSDTEAFPEVFGEAATILPVVGLLGARLEGTGELMRISAYDYADVVIELMRDPVKWAEASERSRKLAEKHTWEAMLDRFETMLEALIQSRKGVMA